MSMHVHFGLEVWIGVMVPRQGTCEVAPVHRRQWSFEAAAAYHLGPPKLANCGPKIKKTCLTQNYPMPFGMVKRECSDHFGLFYARLVTPND